MKRKIYVSLGLMALLLCFLTGALAAYDLTDSGISNLAVIYIPGTQDQTEVDTAIFVKEVLKARFPGGKTLIKNISSNALREEADNTIFKTSKSTGREGQLKEKIYDELLNTDYQVWFLVPDKAAEGFCGNTELFEQLKALVKDRIMRIHVVFIGNTMAVPGENSALALFAAETGRADWGWTAGNFLSTAQRTEGNRKVYTGNYFIADLYGTAAELPVTRTEDSFVFTLPGGTDGTVLAVSKAEKINEAPLVAEDMVKTASEITVAKKGTFGVTKLDGLAAGEYSITFSGGAEYTHIYFYPDLTVVTPAVTIGNRDSETIERGETELVLTVENDLGVPSMFSVSFDCAVTGAEENVSEVKLPAEYDEAGKCWRAVLTTGAEDTAFMVVPKISWNTPDGNAVGDWQGEEMLRKIETVNVTVRDDAPAEAVVYFDENRSGKTAVRWDEIFSYNTADNLVPAIAEAEKTAAENLGYVIEMTEEGFALSVNPGLTGEGTIMGGADGTAVLTLSCGGVTAPLTLKAENVSGLSESIQIGTDAAEVKAGGSFTLYAEIPAETAAKYAAAHAQNEGFFLPADLKLKAGSEEADITAAAEETEFTEKDGAWRAEIGMNLSGTAAARDGGLPIAAQVVNAKENTVLRSVDTLPVAVINTAPRFTGETDKTGKTVELSGIPKEWEQIGILKTVFGETQQADLLQAAFGTRDLYTLFTDDETGITSVTLSVSPTEGLNLEGLEGESGEDGSWSAVLTKGQEMIIPSACSTKTGKYTIRVRASDGVNESEETTAAVTIQSGTVRIVNYILLGLIALIVILIVLLIIRQIRKPSFDSINIRCLVTTDQNQENCRELMSRSESVPMIQFHKKPAPLSTVLTMMRQPPLSGQAAKAADDIMLLPSRQDEIIVFFGKTALMDMSSHEKKEMIPVGSTYSLRMPDNTNIFIENVR